MRGTHNDSLLTIEANTGSASTEYTDTTVTAETTYFYAVLSLSTDGDGPQSSTVNVTTSAEPQVDLEVWPESHWPGFALRQADVLQSYTA